MREGDSYSRELARRLLAHEAAGDDTPRGLALAAERVYQKLGERLALLIGVEGVRALLARSLQQAQSRYSFLAIVTVVANPRVYVQGLEESVQDLDGPAAREGLEACLASLIGLLETFIGGDLTSQQVYRVWPDLAATQEADR